MISRHKIELTNREVIVSLLRKKNDDVDRFAEKLKDYYGIKNIILTPSGRGGLYLLFKALPQKRVILPAFDCRAVVEAATIAAKEIDYVDIDLTDYNMNVERLRERIKPDSIVVATHQLGIPCKLDEIAKICAENNSVMLEDSAASFGAVYKGKKTGTIGDTAACSFCQNKTFTCSRLLVLPNQMSGLKYNG